MESWTDSRVWLELYSPSIEILTLTQPSHAICKKCGGIRRRPVADSGWVLPASSGIFHISRSKGGISGIEIEDTKMFLWRVGSYNYSLPRVKARGVTSAE